MMIGSSHSRKLKPNSHRSMKKNLNILLYSKARVCTGSHGAVVNVASLGLLH